jgi:hypothetical protein
MKIYELSVEDLSTLMWLLEDLMETDSNPQLGRLQSIITNLNSDYILPIIELESKSNKRFLISNNQINK